MIIGIDGSRAFIKKRTGIEEYSYQVIKHLIKELGDNQVVLYLRKNQEVDFALPKNWKVKIINFPRLWTQLGLSLEMLLNPVDILFIPAHTVPFIHPANTVVTIHGLEYEFCPEAYSFWEKIYMRSSIKNSCKWARTIISVSNNTKKDLMKLYKVSEEKIKVIYEGYCYNDKLPMTNDKSNSNDEIKSLNTKYQIPDTKYLLFVGRLEERKNAINIVNSFEILKEQYKIPHKLVLAGKPGFGYEKIKYHISNLNSQKDIIELGYISEEEKWELLKNADVFLFPTFYEGFGLPILEAQSMSTPVVASNNSSIPEVAECHPGLDPGSSKYLQTNNVLDSHFRSPRWSFGEAGGNDNRECVSALLVDPNNAEEIADAVYKIISDEKLKQDLVEKGLENVKRFSWEKCAREVAEVIT